MKFLTLVIIIVGLIFLFNAGGIETNSGAIINGFVEDGLSSFKDTQLWSRIVTILSLTIGVGAVASLFGRSPDPAWILASFASFFGGIVLGDMLSIYILIDSFGVTWISYAMLLIFGMLAYAFLITLISWWRGVDG
jgi:hypothetical protein